MKNATAYRKKVKALLKDMPRGVKPPSPDEREDPVRVFIRAALEADATDRHAEDAVAALEEEFVDYNELRVALPRELIECIGKDHPQARAKAQRIHLVLTNIYGKANRVSLDGLAELPKTELRRRLRELEMGPYEEACVAMFGFGIPAVPVDDTLAGCLEMDGYVETGSDAHEVQGFLERSVAQKDMPAAHAFFREFALKRANDLAKKRQAEEEAARAEAERKAAEEAEKAERTRKAEQEKEAGKKAKAGKKPKKAKKAKKSTKAASSDKKSAKKTAKKATAASNKASKKKTSKRTTKGKAAKKAKKTKKSAKAAKPKKSRKKTSSKSKKA